MLSLPPGVRVFVALEPTDMRKFHVSQDPVPYVSEGGQADRARGAPN
jgi:hypothetical protein